MKRYIDVDKLKEMVNKQYSYCHGYTGTKKDIYREALLAVKSAIHCQSVSKADVERVIRCKDCRLAEKSNNFDGWYFCKNNQMTHQPTHFCSYGERKEEE